jgi:predicted nucleotidyltransferase
MRTPNPINLAMVKHVAQRLDKLRDSVVFVGGAVVDLLITDPAAPAVRPTKDIDIIVEVVSLHDYYKLADLLRSLGFKEDAQSEAGPVCRWVIDDIKVDTMPVQGQVLGFANPYYRAAVETAARQEIAEGLTIRLISAPCFLATKLEAFRHRGEGDFMGSSDMEDVIAVLDGRPEVIEEIPKAPHEVRAFLMNSFAEILEDDDFLDSISGHLEFESDNPGRVQIFLERVRAIASM